MTILQNERDKAFENFVRWQREDPEGRAIATRGEHGALGTLEEDEEEMLSAESRPPHAPQP